MGYTPPTPVEKRRRSPAPNVAGDATDGSRLQGQIKEVNQDAEDLILKTTGVSSMVQSWMIWGQGTSMYHGDIYWDVLGDI